MSTPSANWTGQFWVVVVGRSYFRFSLKDSNQQFLTAQLRHAEHFVCKHEAIEKAQTLVAFHYKGVKVMHVRIERVWP